MKKLHKALFIVLTLVVGLSFTSCENDYYWKRAEMDFSIPVYGDRNGKFDYTMTIRDVDIQGFNPSREDLVSIRTNVAWLEVAGFISGDVVDYFSIEVDGVGRYDYNYPIRIKNDGDYVEIEDQVFFSFMQDVWIRVLNRGGVDVRVYGSSNIYNDGPFYFDFKNRLELELRD